MQTSPQSTILEFDSMDRLREYVDRRIREISTELASVVRALEHANALLEVKRKIFGMFKLQPTKTEGEGVKLTEETTLLVDPPPEVIVDVYERVNASLSRKLTAYRNLKNVLAQLPPGGAGVSVTLILEDEVPRFLIVRPSQPSASS